MAWYYIILIVVVFYLLLGPIMLGFAKLNKLDPFILERENVEELLDTPKGEKSLIMITVFKPLFTPLFVEKKLIDKIRKK